MELQGITCSTFNLTDLRLAVCWFERLFYGLVRHLYVPDGRNRNDVKVGSKVRVVEKKNQPTGKLTDGIVQRILTSSLNHPHGIKVQLESGIVGRVKEIIV